jgi:hypothetical protein
LKVLRSSGAEGEVGFDEVVAGEVLAEGLEVGAEAGEGVLGEKGVEFLVVGVGEGRRGLEASQ